MIKKMSQMLEQEPVVEKDHPCSEEDHVMDNEVCNDKKYTDLKINDIWHFESFHDKFFEKNSKSSKIYN